MTIQPPPEQYATVKRLVEETAAQYGDEPLLHYDGTSYSYQTINDQANAIANSFLDMGVKKGDHVCTFLYNSPEYLMLWFGLAKIGATLIPLDTRFKADDLRDVIRDSDAETLVLDTNTLSSYEPVRDQLDQVKREFLVGREVSKNGYIPFANLLDSDSSMSANRPVTPDDTMCIIYCTNGNRRSTSKNTVRNQFPSGIVLPHYSYIATGWEMSQNILSITDNDRFFTTLALSNTNAQQITVMASMLAGIDFVLVDKFEPDMFWKQIRQSEATIFSYLESMIAVLNNQPERADDADNPIKYAVGFGASGEIVEDFEDRFDLTVIEGYGLAETATMVTANRVDDRRVGSIGKPVEHVEVEIVDDNGWPVAPGQEGEIVARPLWPYTMITSYYGKPEETLDARQNQWFHTGDIGYRDEDGYLYFITSKQDSIRRIGGLISSLEVETVIQNHPAVWTAIVFGVSYDNGDEDVKAIIVPEDDADLDPVEVIEFCESRLEYFKIPRFIEIVNDPPRTPSKKIKRSELIESGTGETWDREAGYDLMR
jgi:acyl-CoA synthetase (AMP-forming)/AMP-acid ligase II